MNVLVIGSCGWDTLIHVDEIKELHDDISLWAKNVIETVGGTGAGKALALDVLGANVTLVTDLADDDAGKKIRDFFSKTNINLIPLKTDKTVTHTNLMHGYGNRITVFTNFHSKEPDYYDGMEKLVKESDFVFLNINNYCREYIDVIKKHNKLCVVDIHDYDPPNPYHKDFIEAADIITCSDIYLKDKKKFAKDLINTGKKLVVLTSGSKGLYAIDNKNNEYFVEGYNDFEYVDSNGAGDSFASGLMFEYMKSKNIGKALEIGNVCGGIACSSEELFKLDTSYEEIVKIVEKKE